jgi:hypothetical protein
MVEAMPALVAQAIGLLSARTSAPCLAPDRRPGEAMSNTEIVRPSFDAYLAQDRDTAERLIAEDLVFTSPLDDHIDKTAYLKRAGSAFTSPAERRQNTVGPEDEPWVVPRQCG